MLRLTPPAGLLLLAACATRSPAPVAFDRTTYQADYAAWRAKRLDAIAGPDGWATLVGLHWLDRDRLTLGADSGNAIVLPAGHAPPHLGTLDIVARRVRFAAAPGISVRRDTLPGLVDTVALQSDSGHRRPTVIRSGGLSLRVIDRGGRLALRVKDTAAPERLGFRGLDYFPIDSASRVTARLVPHATPHTLKVTNILGQPEEYPSPGILSFDLNGRRFELIAAQEPGDSTLFIIFRDSTSLTETYQAARFLGAAAPGPDGITILDFNRAYNPPCAFTAFSTCPLPPPENILATAIRAGEKRYAGQHGYQAPSVTAAGSTPAGR